MNWYEPIDIYCERITSHYWAEPFNAISNGSFVLAGLWGLFLVSRLKRQSEDNHIWTLIFSANAILIGVGSFLFHTYANRWSMLADVIPITLFMLLFLLFSVRKLLRLNALYTGASLLAFVLVGATISHFFGSSFNGSASYFHAWISLATIGHFLKPKNWPLAKLFLLAMAIFALSLVFRSIDLEACGAFPLGTHFLWHSLNGALLAVLIFISFRFQEGVKSVQSTAESLTTRR